jgi:DNA-binding GntR family transcriptional regulator
MVRSVEDRSTARLAYRVLKERLLAGELAPGSRLTEEQVATELGTSRTPVREAMRRLVEEGLLVLRPNYGTFVREWTASELRQLFDVRLLLESEVAALAAQRIDAAGVERLVALQDDIEARGTDLSEDNLARISSLNFQFHGVLAGACGNTRLVESLRKSLEAQVVHQTYHRFTKAHLKRTFGHHRELIDAMRVGDPVWARHVMGCHVLNAKHVMTAGEDARAGARRGEEVVA